MVVGQPAAAPRPYSKNSYEAPQALRSQAGVTCIVTLEVLNTGMQNNTVNIRLIETLVARIFSRSVPLQVERVEEGVSTYVYRIDRGNEVFYLRVLPEANASFAPEVHVHELRRA